MSDSVGTAILLTRSERYEPRASSSAYSLRDGMLLLGLPIGRRRVRFNAHRVHDPLDVLAMFPELRLVGFAAVDDAGRFTPAADPADFAQAEYACGCYEFTRPVS